MSDSALFQVVKENLATLGALNPVVQLLKKIALSTHVFPQYYKLDRIRYNPASIAEAGFWKVYKASNFDVHVNVVADSNRVSVRSMQSMP
jgi:hypothetical protein